ncbi:hypothetical protein PybrP1_000690, partial [[Pythium] brassicae (nom. inval.)]
MPPRSADSLLVTSATGRGVSTLNFLASNQKAATTQTILNYFKQVDSEWARIKSIVIDKDFIEWKALEVSLPASKVLLCQFHTMSYWKKVVQQRKYNLKVAQHEAIV